MTASIADLLRLDADARRALVLSEEREDSRTGLVTSYQVHAMGAIKGTATVDQAFEALLRRCAPFDCPPSPPSKKSSATTTTDTVCASAAFDRLEEVLVALACAVSVLAHIALYVKGKVEERGRQCNAKKDNDDAEAAVVKKGTGDALTPVEKAQLLRETPPVVEINNNNVATEPAEPVGVVVPSVGGTDGGYSGGYPLLFPTAGSGGFVGGYNPFVGGPFAVVPSAPAEFK
jgi:hypothetical protein